MCYSDVTSCQGASPVLTETAIACCNNNGGATSSYRLNDRPGFCISCGDYSSVVGFEQQSYTVVEGNSMDVCVSFLDGRLMNVTLNVSVAIDQSTATPGIDYRLFQRTSSSPGDSPGGGPIGIDPPPFEPVPPTEPTGNSPVPPPSGQRNEALPRGVVLGDQLVILTLNESCRRQCFSVEANRDTLEEMETVIFSLTVSPDSPAVPEGRLPAFIDTRGSTVVIEDFCDAGQVICVGEEKCILRDYVCDGIPDCTATISTFASDETNCAAVCVDGDSRLIGGATSAEGLLETCFNGVYRPVNAEGFTVLEASTVCRQLGIATGGFPRLSGLDFSDLAVQITLRLDVSCGGDENSLADCNISSSVNLAFGEGGPPVSRRLAAVSCITDAVSCSNGDVRLVGGSPREGRLEICYEGVWGSVSDGSWGFLDASVVCQQLGFPGIGALPVFPSTYPGTPSPPILESPVCSTGNESSLLDCPASGSALGVIPRSASISIVGVKCDDYAPVSCSDLEVRLTHRDRTGTNGQIQICDASVNATGVWSTACSCFVDRTDADVICRQLGCLNFQSQYFDNPVVSAGSGPIFERNLPCRGLEETLDDCFDERIRRVVNEAECTHQNDVSVNCAGLPVLFFSPPSPDDCYTVEVGRQFQVDCSVFGEVHPSHSVLSSGGRSTSQTTVQVFSTNAGGIQPGDAGEYSCTAVSIPGITTRNITIKVLAPAEGQEPNSTAYLQFSVLSSVPQNGGDDNERPPLPPLPPPPFETAEVEPPSQSSQLLNIISVDYPGVQTTGCSEVLPRAIELARGLDRFECLISQFATSQDQPPIISARQIATGVALVLSRIVPAFLITVEDFADLDTQLEMLVNNVTAENFEAVVSELSSIANRTATEMEEQTDDNLGRIAVAFNSVAGLVANGSLETIESNTIRNLVDTLNSILQWDPRVLAANGSNIVEDFELIAAVFANQSVGIVFTTPDIAFVAENRPLVNLQVNGRSFSSFDDNGEPDPDTSDGLDVPATLAPLQTAFINLPPSIFNFTDNRTNIGVFFAVYDNPSLFPVAEAEVENSTRVITVLSPVIAATVGPGLSFMNLDPPISILLRLQELGENDTMSFGSERCVSWVFEANGGEGDWTTEGCETIGLVDGVVTCQCSHLTNFAILVDICSRFDDADCTAPPALTKALEVLTIIGVSLSLFGLVMTIITLLVFKKLRERDATKYHVQLCIAMICMLLVFITGINRTAVYGGCVLVSVLIHYFTLVAVLWMTAEALLMFQKLVIVFTRITTKFIILVSILCWTIPIVPVSIPLIVDLTTRPEQDIVVNRDQFCFLNHPGAFFGAFLGPIFALLIFNVIIFIWVIVVLVRHTKGSMERQQQGMKKETAIRLVISISGIMFLFGLTWLFGALTITVTAVNLLFQILFVVFNSLQGFFIFLFFCVFSKEARESWKEVLSCGRYKSEFLHPSQAKITSTSNTVNRNKKLLTATTGLDATSSAAKSYDDTDVSKNTLDGNEYSDIPMVSVSEPSELTKQDLAAEDTGPSIAQIISAPDSEKDTNVDSSHDISTHNGDEATKGGESLKPLKARVKRYSTKKARKHHVETMEVDFDDDDSDDSDLEL